MPLFDFYIMVDWSGGARRRCGRSDTIWIAHGRRTAHQSSTNSSLVVLTIVVLSDVAKRSRAFSAMSTRKTPPRPISVTHNAKSAFLIRCRSRYCSRTMCLATKAPDEWDPKLPVYDPYGPGRSLPKNGTIVTLRATLTFSVDS